MELNHLQDKQEWFGVAKTVGLVENLSGAGLWKSGTPERGLLKPGSPGRVLAKPGSPGLFWLTV